MKKRNSFHKENGLSIEKRKEKKYLSSVILFLIGLLLCLPSFSLTTETYSFSSAIKKKQFQQLIQTLRCPVCQNQNLADSEALLARDLRRMVYERLQQGATMAQIKAELKQAYGDFIFFDPPFMLRTTLLWLSPFFLFFVITLSYYAQKMKYKLFK